jgi:hypothetical protein
VFQDLDNWEKVIREDYLEKVDPSVADRLTHDTTIDYGDATYTGDAVDGKRWGFGTIEYQDGRAYTGEWVDDVRVGRGTETYSSGNVFKGHYVNGRAEGYGIYTWVNGDEYRGDWF